MLANVLTSDYDQCMSLSINILDMRYVFDNYNFLLRDEAEGITAVIDPAEADGVLKALDDKGWRLDYILNTHHHWDHTDGNKGVKKATGAKVVGFDGDAKRIPEIDIKVKAGERFMLGATAIEILHVPGHTTGHIAFYAKEDDALFSGDAMFCMGCGRMFEGTAEVMLHSLELMAALPDKTMCYCGHEYTENNGKFAQSVEPNNPYLHKRMEEVKQRREQDKPTIPASIGEEKLTNPFLRTASDEIREMLDMENAPAAHVFAELRARKDAF